MATEDLSIAGRIVIGPGEPDWGGILIAKGSVVEEREGLPCRIANECIYAEGVFLSPGAIDSHVHSGSHSGEKIGALKASAPAGGVTTVVDKPYDVDSLVVKAEVMAAKRDRVLTEVLVEVALSGTVRPDSGDVDVAPLAEVGAVGVATSGRLEIPPGALIVAPLVAELGAEAPSAVLQWSDDFGHGIAAELEVIGAKTELTTALEWLSQAPPVPATGSVFGAIAEAAALLGVETMTVPSRARRFSRGPIRPHGYGVCPLARRAKPLPSGPTSRRSGRESRFLARQC
jgi:hypothetical protein